MQDSERDRLTVEVCEAVSAISPAGSHLATTAARLREMVGQEVPAGDYMKEAERLLDEICRCKWAEGAHDADGNLKEAQLCEDEANKLYFTLLAHIQRGAVPMPAEVPMPEDDMSDALGELAGVDTHDVNLRDNPESYEILGRLLHTYGDAREAAGYARGLKEAGRDAERYSFLRGDGGPTSVRWPRWEVAHWTGNWNPVSGKELDAAIDAALRGEVK